MVIMHMLQQSTGTRTGDRTGIGDSTCIGDGTSTGDNIGTGIGPGAQDEDYFLTVDGLVRLRDRIYVSDSSDLKMVILREFHVKPYSSHPGYQKTLDVVKKFYYWSNLKMDVVEFVARW